MEKRDRLRKVTLGRLLAVRISARDDRPRCSNSPAIRAVIAAKDFIAACATNRCKICHGRVTGARRLRTRRDVLVGARFIVARHARRARFDAGCRVRVANRTWAFARSCASPASFPSARSGMRRRRVTAVSLAVTEQINS